MDNNFGNKETENPFNGLSEENKRLIRDLISFNKCLNVLNKFKAFIDLISDKIKTNLDLNELQMFENLNKEVEEVFRRETDLKEIRKNLWNSSNDPFNEFQLLTQIKKDINKLCEKNVMKPKIVPKKVPTEDELKARDPNYHPKGFLCDVCQKVLKTEDSLIVHKKGQHLMNQEIFSCDFEYCKFKTILKFQLLSHKNRHKTLENSKCGFNGCEQVFKSEDSLIEHFKEEHNITDFRYKCYYGCNKRFPIEDNLRSHVLTVHKTAYKPYKCQVLNCHKMFRFESKLKQHNKIVHERKWGCPHAECDFFGRDAKGLKHHLDSHSKFKCTVGECDQTFVQKLHLKEHQSIAHPSQKLFFCQWEGCDKSFKTESGFRQHSIKHTDTVFTCEWPGCGFFTQNKKSLKTHGVIHMSECNFGCDWPQCGKSFKTKARLENHLRIHKNDRRYVCHWPGCHYRCVDSANLCKHERQKVLRISKMYGKSSVFNSFDMKVRPNLY